jgi:uroporphyrinogen decarboxylase
MRSKERILAVLRGESVDRPPIFDMLRNDRAIEYYAGECFNQDNAEQIVYRAIAAALDATKQVIRVPGKPLWEYPDGREVTWERWTHWVKPLDFDTVDDAASYLRSIIDRPEEFIGDPVSYVADQEQDYLDKQARLGEDFVLFMDIRTREGFHDFYELVGLETFAYLCVDYPNLVAKYLDLNVKRAIQRIDNLTIADRVPMLLYAVDIAAKTRTIFSPQMLRQLLLPRLEAVIEAYHRKGIKVIFHSDGDLREVLDDLVALGINALHPLEVGANMDLGDLRSKYPQLILLGGIDSSQLLPYGSPADVAHAVKASIRAAAPNYILGSTTELHNSIPLDNIRAMIDTARNFHY